MNNGSDPLPYNNQRPISNGVDSDYDSYSDKTQNLKKTLTKERSIWRVGSLEDLLRLFSPSERLLLYGLTILLGVSALALLVGLNSAVSVTIPSAGGGRGA